MTTQLNHLAKRYQSQGDHTIAVSMLNYMIQNTRSPKAYRAFKATLKTIQRMQRVKAGQANPSDCQASEGCRKMGQCSVKAGRCLALTTRDCAQSEVCKKQGQCSLKDGACRRSQTEKTQ